MSLDPTPDAATLLRMKAEREGRPSQRPPYLASVFKASDPIIDVTPVRPISLRIPWSCLISDNAKYLIREGKLYKTEPYRAARKAIAQLALAAMDGRAAFAFPLAFSARVWVPDNRRYDVHNLGKCTIDALTKLVYEDDHWLHRVTWERAGVDVDAPRAELTISPLLP